MKKVTLLLIRKEVDIVVLANISSRSSSSDSRGSGRSIIVV